MEVDLGFQLLHFAGADQSGGIGTGASLDLALGHSCARALRQRRQLFQGFFGPNRGALGSIGGSPGGQLQTDQESDLLIARQNA